MNSNIPNTLIEAIITFSNEVSCVEYLKQLRWDLGQPVCPKCGSSKCTGLKTRKLFQCLEQDCRKQFSVKTGSIFEKSQIPLSKWMVCMWMLSNDKNGISSYEVHRALGVTQKTAWFMLMRIREAMQTKGFVKLSGHVEVDETWIGGKAINMSKKRKEKAGIGSAGRIQGNKTIVLGMVERGGTLVAKVVKDTRRKSLIPEIEQHVEKGSNIYTDALMTYNTLNKIYNHSSVDHQKEFVQNTTHTNTMENFWCLLKRAIKGTYVQVDSRHVNKYVVEQAFRYNSRKKNDSKRFMMLVSQVFGRRLTYNDLVMR